MQTVKIQGIPKGNLSLDEMIDIKKRLAFEANRSQYPEYADALKLIESLEEDLRGTVMLVAQADSGKYLRNNYHRFEYLVDDAKEMTDRYGFFKYWDEDDV